MSGPEQARAAETCECGPADYHKQPDREQAAGLPVVITAIATLADIALAWLHVHASWFTERPAVGGGPALDLPGRLAPLRSDDGTLAGAEEKRHTPRQQGLGVASIYGETAGQRHDPSFYNANWLIVYDDARDMNA